MNDLTAINKAHLTLMQKTIDTLGNILQPISQTQATTVRDGADGWTIVEVVAHLRDFDEIFRNRVIQMIQEENPKLPAFDHEAMAIEQNYNGQVLTDVCGTLVTSRQKTIATFEMLTAEQWLRAGIHPERGPFSMTDAVIQVGHHDVTHIEQITRILIEGVS